MTYCKRIAYTAAAAARGNTLLKSSSYQVVVLRDRAGKCPYLEWLDALAWKTQERIFNRVARSARGQFGDFKALAGRLFEMRLDFGPGYRVYFAEHKGKIILLLTGGDKSTQRRDIGKARDLWQMYLEDNP